LPSALPLQAISEIRPLSAALSKPATIGFDHVSHHHQKKAEWTNRVMFGINGLELALLGGLALLGIASGILPNPFQPRTPPPAPTNGQAPSGYGTQAYWQAQPGSPTPALGAPLAQVATQAVSAGAPIPIAGLLQSLMQPSYLPSGVQVQGPGSTTPGPLLRGV
jgi:hypothetical protein